MEALPEEVQAWLGKARADYVAAQILIEHSALALGPAVFHCQQAAEKALKAFLVWRSVPLEKVHNLVYLCDLCEAEDARFASLREATEFLTPYAVEVRYPGDALEVMPGEAREALAAARRVCEFVLSELV